MKRIFLVFSCMLATLLLGYARGEFIAPETIHIRPFFRFPISKYYTITSNLLRKQVGLAEDYSECSSLQGPRCLYQKIQKDFESIAGLDLDLNEGQQGGRIKPSNIKVIMLDGKEVQGDLTQAIQQAFDTAFKGDAGNQHDGSDKVQVDIDVSEMLDDKEIYNLANQLASQLGEADVDMVFEELQASLANPDSVQVQYLDLRPTNAAEQSKQTFYSKTVSNLVEEDDDEYLDDAEDEAVEKSQINNDNQKQQINKKVVVEKMEIGQDLHNVHELLNTLKNTANLGENEMQQIEQALQQKGFVVLDEQNIDED
eukprot:TRINITY_DN1928_c0_g1_i11.p1 TRINITY_DN1928_c0_g1~~TRINITY_DN1928_c0_g1_i11.p1  ORF type:complete len:362 (-),score=52.78 TRINITY_DN1928_c0_g1_i11:2935-3870(-)